MSTPEPVGRRDEEAERDEDGGGVAARQLEDEGGHVRRPRTRPQLEEAAEGRDVRQHLHCNAVDRRGFLYNGLSSHARTIPILV